MVIRKVDKRGFVCDVNDLILMSELLQHGKNRPLNLRVNVKFGLLNAQDDRSDLATVLFTLPLMHKLATLVHNERL